MAFRKRNIGVQRGPAHAPSADSSNARSNAPLPMPGVRPSPLTGEPTTSTGIYTLDSLLGGHAGLPLGSSLVMEESGTTDYAGALLRFYAAEGIVQGHHIHLVGHGEQWTNELPALVGAADASTETTSVGKVKVDEEKMKIAWRYERLGQNASDRARRVVPSRDPSASERAGVQEGEETTSVFCHAFDLAKRLALPASASVNYIQIKQALPPSISPFADILQSLTNHLESSPATSVHRIVIPTVLSPALYPPHASHPHHFLQFLHSLRALLRRYQTRVTACLTMPLELFHRSSGMVKWAELICNSVVELTPFPHNMDASGALGDSGGARGIDEQPQGMFKVHKVPVTTERGGGGPGLGIGDDLAFTLSRRKFVIKPFSLPPIEGDTEAQKGEADHGALGKASKVDIEF